MNAKRLASMLAWVSCIAWAGGLSAAQSDGDAGEIERMIRDLGDSRWRVRESATERLIDIGPSCFEALRAAFRETDRYEVRRRIRRIAEDIRLEQESAGQPGFMGIQMDPASGRDPRGSGPNRCIRVAGTIEGTAAERAGLRTGDLIVAINGKWFSDDFPSANFKTEIERLKAGGRCQIHLLRGGEGYTIESLLQAVPPDELAALSVNSVTHEDDPRVAPGASGLRVEREDSATRALELRPGDLILGLNYELLPSSGPADHFKRWVSDIAQGVAGADRALSIEEPIPPIPRGISRRDRPRRGPSMRVLRGGEIIAVTVTLGRRPPPLRAELGANRPAVQNSKELSTWWHDVFDPLGLVTEGEARTTGIWTRPPGTSRP